MIVALQINAFIISYTNLKYEAIGLLLCATAFGQDTAPHSEPDPSDGTQYETIRIDLSSRDPRYTVAPCAGCLHERAALSTAAAFLDNAGIHHIGLRAELLARFPWRGVDDPEYRFVRDRPLKTVLDRRTEIEYAGHGGSNPEANEGSDETWCVWYQLGWVATELIEQHVEAGRLPLEALSWPPRPIERFLLVHARTGRLAAVPTDDIASAPDVWIERDRRAREFAEDFAIELLRAERDLGDNPRRRPTLYSSRYGPRSSPRH